MAQKLDLDLNKVEQLAARGLTAKEAAAELGLDLKAFANKRYNDRQVDAAWKRGVTTYEKSKGNGQAPPQELSQTSTLTPNEEAVLLEVESAADGACFRDLVISTRLGEAEVTKALRSLTAQKLINFRSEPPNHVTRYYPGAQVQVKDTLFEEAKPTPVEPVVVGGSRTEAALMRVPRTGKSQKRTTALARRTPRKRPAPASAIAKRSKPTQTAVAATPPVIDVEPLPAAANGELTKSTHRALEGAAIELSFMRFHGEPSNKHEDVMKGIAEAMRS
jgi:hypothetical protein